MQAERPESGKAEAGGELELIRRIRQRAGASPSSALPLGIGDDCALLRPRAGEDLAVTTDLSVAGRHFHLDWHPPEVVGHRTLARGLSDLAAMGARPMAAFLSLGLPRALTWPGKGRSAARRSWLERFLDGFLALARANQTPLAGGDLAETAVAVADIVLIGTVPRGRALLRSGARAGDRIYVTGALGGAAAGFARLVEEKAGGRRGKGRKPLEAQLKPHFYPQPRLEQGQWLMRRRLATAAIDISDGLSTDLAHLCEESGVAAEIRAEALPFSSGATWEQAVHGGEDYELLFTARAGTRLPGAIAGVKLSAIGCVVERRRGRPQITLLKAGRAEPLQAGGWKHFA